MSEPVALLQQLGFSEYEARSYVALLQRSPVTGYELAKESGVPRPNIYPVLQKLEERGAVVRLDTPAGARYAPLPPDELVRRLQTRFQGTLSQAQQSLAELGPSKDTTYVWNIRGTPAVLEHARSLIDAAQERLLLALWPPEALALADGLAQASERGLDMTLLCLQDCPQECASCRGHIYRYAVQPDPAARWLVLVRDNTELLAGEVGADQEALAVHTRQPAFVELAGWYIRHSIALAAVLNDLGGRLRQLLSPETQTLLAALAPVGQAGGWHEHMRALLALQPGDPPLQGGDPSSG